MKKIAYMFTSGRKERLEEEKSGSEIPHEFFFGATTLIKFGYEIDLFELDDFRKDKLKLNSGRFTKYRLTGLNSCSHLIDVEKIKKLNEYDLIIASNEYIALGLYDYVKKKVLTTPFIFFVMGMLAKVALSKKANFNIKHLIKYHLGKFLYDDLLQVSKSAIFIGQGEYQVAKDIFPKHEQKMKFISFPVDTNFWKSSDTGMDNYILFMGNDMRRDFDLLLEITRSLPQEKFIIISQRLQNKSIPKNVELIQGDWKEKVISDIGIREYIRNASILILPLLETYQPSGQSVTQQAMACKIPVIITKTKGFWDKKKFTDKKHLIFVEKNEVEEWVSKIKKLNSDSSLKKTISENAHLVIEKYFNLNIFNEKLLKIILE